MPEHAAPEGTPWGVMVGCATGAARPKEPGAGLFCLERVAGRV